VEETNQLETPAALCPPSAGNGALVNLYALKKSVCPADNGAPVARSDNR